MKTVNKKPENPNAFPEIEQGYDNVGCQVERLYSGMTLKDYFATKAMQGMITGIDTDEKFIRYRNVAKEKGMSVSEWIAADSYKQANAMLIQREASYNQDNNIGTSYIFQFYSSTGGVLADTELITLEEAKKLWNDNYPVAAELIKNRTTIQMAVWAGMDENRIFNPNNVLGFIDYDYTSDGTYIYSSALEPISQTI